MKVIPIEVFYGYSTNLTQLNPSDIFGSRATRVRAQAYNLEAVGSKAALSRDA